MGGSQITSIGLASSGPTAEKAALKMIDATIRSGFGYPDGVLLHSDQSTLSRMT
jgi:hypothetical protein